MWLSGMDAQSVRITPIASFCNSGYRLVGGKCQASPPAPTPAPTQAPNPAPTQALVESVKPELATLERERILQQAYKIVTLVSGSDCPINWYPITSATDCESAAASASVHGKTINEAASWQGTESEQSNPKGCYWSDGEVSFNTHTTGIANTFFKPPICTQVASQAGSQTLDAPNAPMVTIWFAAYVFVVG